MSARAERRMRRWWSLAQSLLVATSGCYTIGTVQSLRRCATDAPAAEFSGVGTPTPTVAWTLECGSVGAGIVYARERSGHLQLAPPSGCTAPALYALGTDSDARVCSGATQAVDVDARFALQLVDPVTAAAAALALPSDPCAVLVAVEQGSGDPQIVALTPDGRAAAGQRVDTPCAAWLAMPTAVFVDVVFLVPALIVGGLIALPYWLGTGHLTDGEHTHPSAAGADGAAPSGSREAVTDQTAEAGEQLIADELVVGPERACLGR